MMVQSVSKGTYFPFILISAVCGMLLRYPITPLCLKILCAPLMKRCWISSGSNKLLASGNTIITPWGTTILVKIIQVISYTRFFFPLFNTTPVLFQYHEKYKYPIREHGRNCRGGQLSFTRIFSDSSPFWLQGLQIRAFHGVYFFQKIHGRVICFPSYETVCFPRKLVFTYESIQH